jgi:hypothetical protein
MTSLNELKKMRIFLAAATKQYPSPVLRVKLALATSVDSAQG